MKAQQLRSKTGVLTETAGYTNQKACDGSEATEYENPKMQGEAIMFMKTEQLNATSGTLTEFQVTQNKQLAMMWVGRSAK